ncbi:hypothetical protein [Nocardia mangyaensis]|uniref:hypothetical protein n=1 Tax=Nocardia mangyaensis TaxID=2213200 RepID=UPI002675C761|nr:hypothetical protein [Nocardia mangyaensis]MDO3650815.1 hypothetical protein [Nocardia mangyaensis]
MRVRRDRRNRTALGQARPGLGAAGVPRQRPERSHFGHVDAAEPIGCEATAICEAAAAV